MGVGLTSHLHAVEWTTVERMVWVRQMTLLVPGLLGYALMRLAQWVGA